MSLRNRLNTRRRTTLLALLALLLGQWALLTHVHKQDAPAPDETCWLCIHAQHDGNAIPAAGTAQAVVAAHISLPPVRDIRFTVAVSRHFNPRAPPLFPLA